MIYLDLILGYRTVTTRAIFRWNETAGLRYKIVFFM